MICDRCGHRLYGADVIARATVCIECERKACMPKFDEWATFKRALRTAADADGVVSQTRMRPLIQRIEHKHRGLLYRRAVSERLIVPDGYEDGTDTKGRNSDKPQRRYRLVRSPAA